MRNVDRRRLRRRSCFEVQPDFGTSVVTALCRLGGHPVAVDREPAAWCSPARSTSTAPTRPRTSSPSPTRSTCRWCSSSDNPGVLPGSASESDGILRKGARMYAAQTLATSPKFEVTLRKAYGFGSMVMGMIPFDGQSARVRVPRRDDGRDGRGGDEPRDAAPTSTRRRSCAKMELEASYRSAKRFGFDELIDPREIRNVLLHSLERALHRRQVGRPSRSRASASRRDGVQPVPSPDAAVVRRFGRRARPPKRRASSGSPAWTTWCRRWPTTSRCSRRW